MPDDIQDLQKQIDWLSDGFKFHAQMISNNYKEFMEFEKATDGALASLRKQIGDPSKSPEKDIADLKARVKDLEGKLAKMGKK